MKAITFIAAIALAIAVGIGSYRAGKSDGTEQARAEFESTLEPCWGDILMEDFVLDVVDETNFWEVCDSTEFSGYQEYSSEWYLAVICEFSRIYR